MFGICSLLGVTIAWIESRFFRKSRLLQDPPLPTSLQNAGEHEPESHGPLSAYPPWSLPWARAVVVAPDATLLRHAAELVSVAQKHPTASELRGGFRRLVELGLAENTAEPDQVLCFGLSGLRWLAHTEGFATYLQRIPEPGRLPLSARQLQAWLATPKGEGR
jgi:hypothetical protein